MTRRVKSICLIDCATPGWAAMHVRRYVQNYLNATIRKQLPAEGASYQSERRARQARDRTDSSTIIESAGYFAFTKIVALR
jgi:hypothetical protein